MPSFRKMKCLSKFKHLVKKLYILGYDVPEIVESMNMLQWRLTMTNIWNRLAFRPSKNQTISSRRTGKNRTDNRQRIIPGAFNKSGIEATEEIILHFDYSWDGFIYG